MATAETTQFYVSGQEYRFFGVDSYHFKLDNKVFEAVEDESDGYRSYLGSVERVDTSDLIFPRRALDTVTITEVTETYGDYIPGDDVEWDKRYPYGGAYPFDGYVFRSTKDGHVWLVVGTNDHDDYYPSFVFRYTPREAS